MTFRTGKTRPAGADSTNGARQARARRGLSCLAAGLALAFLGGCDNLFSGEDLKAKIKDEVTVTNAEEVTVTVRPDPAMPGATGTAVSVTKQKVGVPFPISVSVNEDYTFIGWTSAGDGSPSYEKVGSVSTTATIGTSGSNIIIQANFATKPKVLSTDPRSDQDQVVLNKSLTIFFSEDIDPSSLAKSLFTITSIGIGMSGMPASIIDKYDDPFAVGTNGIRLPIKSSALLGQTNQIDVTLSSALPFLSGRSMKASKSWSFYTGTSSDTTAPNFDSVNSKIQPALGPDGETNASPIIIDVIAGDTEGTVQLMRIRETPIDPPGPAVEYSYDNVYQRNLSYPLATAGEGSKKIEVWVADNNGNWTPSPWTKTIIFDRSLPVVSGFSLDSGAAYSADTSVTASASVSDANDDIQARFSNDGTTYGAWTAFNGLTTLTIPVNDGLKTVYAQFRDAAGNLAADTYQDSIELDGTLPLVSLARTPAGASIAGGTVVSFVATIVEAGGFTSTPTLAVAGVESGLVMSTLSSSSPWIYACDWTVPSNTIYDGVHAVIVSATDRAGNVNSVTSGANSIAIDNTPPGDVSGATATANAGGTVTLAWTNPGDVDFRRVRVSWTGPAPGTTTETHTCADDATTFTTDVLADGSYSFAIKTEDDLGNIQASGVTKSATADATPPSDAIGVTATANAGGTVTLAWTNPGDADFRRVRVSWTGPAPGTTTGSDICADDATTYTTGILADGSYSFAIKTEDDLGNIQASGVTKSATTDATPPGNVSGATATVNAGGTVTLVWTNPGDADFRRVRVSWTGPAPGTTTGSDICADDATTYTTGALADGSYSFAIKTEDDLGNIQASGVTKSATTDATPPGDVSGATATANAGGTVTLAWTNPGDADFRRVRVSWTGPAPGTTTGSDICADDATTYTTGILADGSYSFAIKTEDDLGNIRASGVTKSATADATPPSIGATFQINGGSDYSNNTSVAVSFTPTDATTGNVEYAIGDVSLEANIPAAPGTGWTSIAQGSARRVSHAITSAFSTADDTAFIYLYLRDSLGNTSATAIRGSVKYSSTPSISVVSASANGTKPRITFTNGSTAIVSVKYWAGDQAKTVALVAGQPIYSQDLAVAADGSVSAETLTSLAEDGAFSFLVADNAGHESQAYGFVYGTDYSTPTARSLIQTPIGDRPEGIGRSGSTSMNVSSSRLGMVVPAPIDWDSMLYSQGTLSTSSVADIATVTEQRTDLVVQVGYPLGKPKAGIAESTHSTSISPESIIRLSLELASAAKAPESRVWEPSEVPSTENRGSASPRLVGSETLIHQADYALSAPSGGGDAVPSPPPPQPAAPNDGVPPLPPSVPKLALAPAPTSLVAKRRGGVRFKRSAGEK